MIILFYVRVLKCLTWEKKTLCRSSTVVDERISGFLEMILLENAVR